MSDGSIVPGDHEGMAAYRGPNGTTILVRNHELSNHENKFGNLDGVLVSNELKYDTWCHPNPVDYAFANSTRGQGQAKGASIFSRGESVWYGNERVYFCCSNEGNLCAGQIWAYDPAAETLTLVIESESRDGLDAPDNITVGPDGRIYMFEDGRGGNNIVGVNSEGELFRVAENLINTAEFCGGCFSHNGRFIYVNIQNPGMTLVIEGPWRKGQA